MLPGAFLVAAGSVVTVQLLNAPAAVPELSTTQALCACRRAAGGLPRRCWPRRDGAAHQRARRNPCAVDHSSAVCCNKDAAS